MKNNQIQSHDILCNISNFILDGHNRKGLCVFFCDCITTYIYKTAN